MKKPPAALQKAVHFLTAFTIALKGFAKLEHAHDYWPVIALFFAAAIYIVTITVLHDRLHHHVRLLTASVYAIECGVTAIVALLYAHEGKRFLHYALAFAAAMFAVALIVHLTRTPRHVES
ncbi:MAG: hypothetical protein M3Q69_21095 [Acidobacteriota bacterium]|nr:hypothetical protein [Acidobacteriota bacterium]